MFRSSGANLDSDREFADRLLQQIKHIPGATDLRIQQPFNQPKLFVDIDRTKSQQVGYSAREIARQYSGFLERKLSDISHILAQSPQRGKLQHRGSIPAVEMDSLQDLRNVPIGGNGSAPQILASLASIKRGTGLATVSHYNIAPVVDIYGAVQGTRSWAACLAGAR